MTKYENYYKALEYLDVQEDGTVWRKERSWISGKGVVRYQPRQMAKTRLNKFGYVKTDVCIDGKSYYLLAHVLVALVFIPMPDEWNETWQVNHINGNKVDNRVENLEWVTQSENMKHAYHTGLAIHSENCGSPKRPVEQVCLKTGEVIAAFISQHEAERQTGFDNSHISKCCLGKQKTAYGYRWRYAS